MPTFAGSSYGSLSQRATLAFFVAVIAFFWFATQASAASKALGFGREVIVDHQRAAGEPSIAIDGQDRI